LVLAFSTQSFGKSKKPFLPNIPRTWTEINPADVYPEFEYNGLTPSCAACPPSIDPDTGQLEVYDPEFTFFVKGGKTNKLVIYFQGGGACWDSMNCLYAHTYYEEVPPIGAFANTEGMGIFDTDNRANPFKNWYMVYIPYCTGDIHWGANDNEYPDYMGGYDGVPQTIRHRGFVNFQVVLKWVEDNFKRPRKIFVTGSSAGSYGAIMGFPYIKEAFPRSRVDVLGDAGNGVVGGDFQDNASQNWGIQFPLWVSGFEGGYDENMSMDFIYTSIAQEYPFSKVAQFTTAWDSTQAFFYNVMLNINNPDVWEANVPLVWCDWHNQMLDFAWNSSVDARNYRYYIAAGDYHTIMMSPQFYTEDSAGISFAKWVKAMVYNPFGMWGGPLQGRWRNMECEYCMDPLPCP
jgi:hypothetical protein